MAFHRLLRSVPFYKGLKIYEGGFAHNYEDLLLHLKTLSDKEFEELLKKNKNYIIEWIKENYEDEKLIKQLTNKNNKPQYISVLKIRIKELKKEAEALSSLVKQRQEIIKKKTSFMPLFWISIYIALFTLLILQHVQYTNQTDLLKNELIEERKQTKIFYDYNNLLRTRESELETELSHLLILNEELNMRNDKLLEDLNQFRTHLTEGPIARINRENIEITSDGVMIKIKEPYFAMFTDTKSMIPTINSETKAIQIVPSNYSQISVGDIISFELGNKIIIHRVTEINYDEEGWYAITKGDNAQKADKEKVRFEQIRRVLVALIY